MENPSVIFGENCFDDSVMQNRLPMKPIKRSGGPLKKAVRWIPAWRG